MPNRVAGRIALPAPTPPDHAIPQLLLSSAWARLTPVMRIGLTVFPHRGLSPHQFTPMSGAHQPSASNAGWPVQFRFAVHVFDPACLDVRLRVCVQKHIYTIRNVMERLNIHFTSRVQGPAVAELDR